MNYIRKYFDPKSPSSPAGGDAETIVFPWEHDGQKDVYVFAPRVILAVNVALATKRPLLVAGEPGSGKTRLGAAIAAVLQWQFYARTVTSRTQASEFLWTFDSLRRLNDATNPKVALGSEQSYVEPGPVWWGFSPATAVERGLKTLKAPALSATDPSPPAAGGGAVILIDEIDKADPDVPNDLLGPFDVRAFRVKETDDEIKADRELLLILTTNGERELPPAFLRRCVMLVLAAPDQVWFERVAKEHFPKGDAALHSRIAAAVQRLRTETKAGARKPSTAEFLDAVDACRELGLDTTSPEWPEVIDSVLLKSDSTTASSTTPIKAASPERTNA